MTVDLNGSLTSFLTESGFSESTKKNYGRFIGYVAEWLQDQDLELHELRPADFMRFLETRDWSDNTRYHCLQALRSYFRFAFGDEHPILRMKVSRQQPPPQQTLTPAEVCQLFEAIDGDKPVDLRNRAMLMLMLDTGLRAAEVCELELERLDLENRILDVLAKGGRWRRAVFSEDTRQALCDWLQVRLGDPAGKVFVSEGGIYPGGPLTPAGLRAIFRLLGERAGIPGMSPHVMRRTFATLATARGAPTRMVQVAGGWSSIEMVERYTRALKPEDFQGYFPTAVLSTR